MNTHSLKLPNQSGELENYEFSQNNPFPLKAHELSTRRVFAAVHVVADPLADNTPGSTATIDWETTMAYRRHIWSLGLGVADAMDTAQRGMGLNWEAAEELIRRSGREAKAADGKLAVGVNTDRLTSATHGNWTLTDIKEAYLDQCETAEQSGAQIVLMSSRQLVQVARGPDDYANVYNDVLSQVKGSVLIHWLGEKLDPALAGYWGDDDFESAMNTCLGILSENAKKIDGIKLSVLNKDYEIRMRAKLPKGVRMYTGDDFNYPELIAGDRHHHSDALLGIFDPIAPAAAEAIAALDEGDLGRYHKIFGPTQTLSRHIFATPSYYYKTGIVFMAYLNGHQDHFRMVAGQESARSIVHLCELLKLADRAGLILDPEQASHRMKHLLALSGID